MELSDLTINPVSKKKRKSRKGLEKAYKCSEPDCNKRFTRMEHLARHQLNHNPKQIYECSWPGCDKSFVREDLQKRHFKRHEQHGFTQDDTPGIVPKYEDQQQQKAQHLQHLQKHQQQQQTPPGQELEIIHSEQLTPLNGNESYKIGDGDAPLPLDTVASASEIISWIFSDAMLANVKEPLLSPSYYTFDSPMALQNLLTPPAAHEEPQIGLNKRQQMLELIPNLLPELSQLGYTEDSIFEQRFITTYWTTFHPQFPILHKPTFSADQCPGALLWCIVMIGAAMQKEVVIARSIAEPLRWIIFGSADFNPPAKLWIIQALLILEVYEKTMSDRQMHERAIIHHGTTLQLIRRGTILTGEDSGYLAGDSGDPWKRWIQSEATKRAALMAFVVDAYHNCMFGHHSLISIHEIRLSLPCIRTALQFLEEMYLYRDNPSSSGTRCCPNPFMVGHIVPGQYQASKDALVHRPHAIFLCTLVIWCYGFVLNGPESDIWTTMNETVLPDISNRTAEEEAMAALERANTLMLLGPKRTGLEFIKWFSKTIDQPTPRNKMSMLEGRNETSGLLKLVIDSLRGADWVLIDEDVRLLTHCLERTLGKPQQKCSYHI
ncbi:hypothetical protein D0Z00_003108 [Geotrichum galactomycetum]|uniref:Uncharacterized protein n=1 Tax=Geotrichum galactomycetum TaxID=27317 RepID=A0ACB6V280_9ASCO|nr:hypothetical protein D0Z00_003108 [Geotrichum candidum]